jgi:signal transduction histidine kinase
VVSEALANVDKHARASRATVRLRSNAQDVLIEIADDGIGGADDANGSGLRGLADRVEALGGQLGVVSKAGGGTTVTGVIPCAS